MIAVGGAFADHLSPLCHIVMAAITDAKATVASFLSQPTNRFTVYLSVSGLINCIPQPCVTVRNEAM